MGTCKVVKGTYGYTSVIYDTALYNYVSAFNSGTFYENGSLTTEGQTFYNLLHDYCRIARFSFGCNLDRGGDQIDYRAALSVFKIFFLNADVFSLLLTSSRYELFNSNVAGSYVYLEPGATVGVIKSFLSNNGTSNYNIYGSCEMYPYGFVMNSPYFRLRISIPIYNDDGSSATSIGLTMQDAGTVTGQKWGSSASFINSFPTWLGALPPWSDTDDPFKPGGHSTHGGGGRSFDDSSDPVDIPPVPVDPVLNSGFVSLYKMDTMKLMDLATFMWDTNLFDVNAWQKVMANPFDAIISLKYVPANPNTLPNPAPIKIGNVQTNVSAPVVSQQYVQIQCGTLDVEEYSGSYLDYSPYTKVEIYLPFIGFRELNTDEVMDKTLTLTYNVDVLSGSCVANIKVGDTVLYQFAGECAMDIPITGRDSGKTLAGILGVIASAGSAVGGAIGGVLNPESAVKGVTAAAESVIGGKRNIQRSGNVTGSAGFMGGQTPYLIITRQRQALPEEQNLFMGYPSFITSLLGDLSGMTIVADCHLENIPCTDGELQEIERLLKEGVIL